MLVYVVPEPDSPALRCRTVLLTLSNQALFAEYEAKIRRI